ncbi:MAG: MMPL family transporter [Treponema sp.]|nr:MMPL family transporter [Treponema sp.]
MNRSILENKFFLSWALVHLAVFIFFLTTLLCGTRFKINAGLFDILPESSSSREAKDAENVLSSKTGRAFVILVKDKEFSVAKENAEKLYTLLTDEKNKDSFDNINLYVDDNVLDEISSFYFKHRYHLLGDEELELLSDDEGVEQFVEEAQAELFMGPVSSVNVEEDPFVLSELEVQNVLSKIVSAANSMHILGGVITARYYDNDYVMIRGYLKPESVAITNKKSGVKKIKECISELKKDIKENSGETEILVSGIPFHSYESSSSAQREISIIAVISIVLIGLLCFYIFKNVVPVVYSVGAICLSSLCALCTVLAVFKEIHILTFVFGTTLIGTCLDYSIHYFIRWRANKNLTDGEEIRKHLLKGLTLSLVSTLISYILLLFTPFKLLKQISVFCASGILSSYLTVIGFYPLLKMPSEKKEIKLAGIFENFSRKIKKRSSLFLKLVLIICLVFTYDIRKNKLKIDNSLKTMYLMEGELLLNENEVNAVLDSGVTGAYFIVRGRTGEEVLEKEERLCKKMDEIFNLKNDRVSGYNCVTKFIPSKEKQKKSYEALEKIMPYAKEQYELIGLEAESKKKAEYLLENYRAAKDDYVELDDVPGFVQDAVSNLWLGKQGDYFYSCVMPLHIYDDKALAKIAEEDEDFYFISKRNDIETELNKLTKTILVLLCAAFAVMAVVLKFFYKIKDVFRIMAIPLVTAASCIGFTTWFGVPLGFFSITGIVLVFGLSVDYIIYSVENSSGENSLAVAVSFVTSLLSFGLLAFSSFMPVFTFGMTVAIGHITAVLGTFFLKSE